MSDLRSEVINYPSETKRLWRLCLDNKINPLFNSKTGHYDFDTQERRHLMREVLNEIFAETSQ